MTQDPFAGFRDGDSDYEDEAEPRECGACGGGGCRECVNGTVWVKRGAARVK